MKKTFYILCAFLPALMLPCSCEQGKDDSAFKGGSCIAVAEVGAAAGSLSISVETSGTWRLGCKADWLSFDVDGGLGNQAFTVYYGSNEPDILNLRQARTAKIAISLDEGKVSDTLTFIQRGFLGGSGKANVKPDKRISLEFDSQAITEAKFISCSADGLDDSAPLIAWIESKGADAYLLDGRVEGSLPGDISILGCNFSGMDAEQEYQFFKFAVDYSVNSDYEGNPKSIVAGKMPHYSSMQTGYPSTPQWYPTDAKGPDFRSDRYAWQNNLYDAVWMAKRDYVSTYTDDQGRSYCADYVYVSSDVLGAISDVELVPAPVAGMTHKAIVITIKY